MPDQLHKANVDIHQVASIIGRHIIAGNREDALSYDKQFIAASKQVMMLLRELGKDN